MHSTVGCINTKVKMVQHSDVTSLTPISQLRFDYDTTTIRRYRDPFDYDGSDRNYDLRSIRLRHDYDEKLAR